MGYPVVRIVPHNLSTELAVLITQGQVAVGSAPQRNSLQAALEPVLGRFLLDDPASTPGLPPIIGKAQEVGVSGLAG